MKDNNISLDKFSFLIIPCLLLLPPLFWSGNIIVGRAVNEDVSATVLSVGRWMIASLVLLPFSYHIIKKEYPLYLQHWRLITLSSVTGISAFNTLVYLGLKSTTANNALILNSFIPLLISLIGAVFLKTSLSLKQWFAMSISFCGVFVILSGGELETITSLSFNKGDLIIFTAVVAWAIYTLSIKRMPIEINRTGLLSVQMLIGMITLLPFFFLELKLAPTNVIWSTKVIASFLYVGIVPSLLAFLLYTSCIQTLGTIKASLSIHLIPVFGILLSFLFLSESIHIYQLVGMVLIFIGILLS